MRKFGFVRPEVRWLTNVHRTAAGPPPGFATDAHVRPVREFHRTLVGYRPTPLVPLPGLAAELGVERLWVKDESKRLELASFKVLGASWAIHRILEEGGGDAFVTATDGNHGRALAWAARERGARAVICLPGAASRARADAIRDLGAEVRRIAGTYDDAVAAAASAAEDEELCLVQDMAWPGYEEIPRWIMQGYTTLVDETLEQLAGVAPTHVFLPCGVGSFAASVIARLAACLEDRAPAAVLVEPQGAASATAAFEKGGDRPPLLAGDTHTLMACLACGQLSHGAWPLLRDRALGVLSISDEVARRGMRRLGAPPGDDPPLVSGESGAVGAGVLDVVAAGDAPGLLEALEIDRSSRLLLISTEGATDPAVWREVVGGLVQ